MLNGRLSVSASPHLIVTNCPGWDVAAMSGASTQIKWHPGMSSMLEITVAEICFNSTKTPLALQLILCLRGSFAGI
jgi:hypothetical protein